ncbi:MAG: hypothetical protein A4E28_02263 [Methanocella sp. PtaU1.Bin125]|nr:MAG: hypothetical protein A4E28_02263 [Methanocella sp. PtaU1.Bin125]
MDGTPSRWDRYFSWVMISLVSFFFAEIISGSSMLRSLEPGAVAASVIWSLIVTIPLYGLHTIVLAWVVYRYSQPRLYTLFFAGVIFGLYEAYITKVLWVGWGPDTVWFFGGVAVVETAVLLLFWHPFMAFIIPLFVSESMLTRSREVLAGLPRPLLWLFSGRKRGFAMLLAFMLYCGVNLGGQSPSPLNAIVSALLAFVVFTPLLYLYRRRGLHQYTMRQLMPTKRELAVLLVPLALIYLVMGLGFRAEVLFNLWPQAVVWLMYAAAIALLSLSMRKSKRLAIAPAGFPVRLSKELYVGLFCVLILTSAVVSMVPFRLLIVLAFLFIGTIAGAGIFVLSLIDIVKRAGLIDTATKHFIN